MVQGICGVFDSGSGLSIHIPKKIVEIMGIKKKDYLKVEFLEIMEKKINGKVKEQKQKNKQNEEKGIIESEKGLPEL